MKLPKLLHVTSSLKMGGAENLLLSLIKKMGHCEFEHHVLYFHHGPNVDRLHQIGIKTYHVKGLVSLYDPVFLYRLFVLVRKIKPDVLHSLLWSANVCSRVISFLLNIPSVSVYHNNIDQDGRLRNMLDKLTRNCSGKIITVSDEVKKSLGITRKKLATKTVVIKNGINIKELQEKSRLTNIKREDIGLSKGQFVIGAVGRLHPVKNFQLLLRAFACVHKRKSKARLVIVGSGGQECFLKNLSKELKISEFVRFIVGKQAVHYYDLFDCFVQTSDKEGISIALLEAMSFDLPCIVTNVGKEHPVVIDGHNGLICKAGDLDMLARSIESFICRPDFVSKIGNNAKNTVESNFRLEGMVKSYNNIFTSLSKLSNSKSGYRDSL